MPSSFLVGRWRSFWLERCKISFWIACACVCARRSWTVDVPCIAEVEPGGLVERRRLFTQALMTVLVRPSKA